MFQSPAGARHGQAEARCALVSKYKVCIHRGMKSVINKILIKRNYITCIAPLIVVHEFSELIYSNITVRNFVLKPNFRFLRKNVH